jgi:16S rRNA (adenine1518-N6/adenine1519-N6)-dimethyltransferase
LTLTRSIRRRPGFRPKKRLGQHFLVDSEIIRQIIALAGFQVSDRVLEIGPGLGALTLPLAQSVGHVVAVEKDTQLITVLKKKLSQAGLCNVTLINHDILTFDIRDIKGFSSNRLKIIGNLPYNISSPLLEKLTENRNRISRAVLMFQLEVAKRIIASPGGKTYGAMTLLVQYHAHPTVLLEVPKNAFRPKPKVDSMVLELDFERPYPKRTVHEDDFKEVVKGAFAHRRKTILNSLARASSSWGRDVLLEAMEKCQIDAGRRAETLNMSDFLRLTSFLTLTKEKDGDN